jgi:hypothetical protein
MAKSLTETAKEVLMREQSVNEEFALDKSQHVPSMGTYDKNPDRDAKSTTAAKSSLKPGSKYKAPEEVENANSNSPDPDDYEDLGGATQKSLPKENLGAKAAKPVSKDTSKSSKASVGSEKGKKLSEDEELEEDEVIEEDEEFDEELGAIIAEMIEAGLSDEEIEQALDEAFAEDEEVIEEDNELELSEELEAFISQKIEEGLSDEEIEEAISENFEFVTEDSDEETDAPLIEREPIDMSEHVNALLEGEELSEEFRDKATTIFESAVNAKLEEEVAILEDAYSKSLQEETEKIYETLSEQVDDYLNYVVENWISENEVAIEPALKTELTEEFIAGLRNLFAEHYISMPDEQVPVVEEMGARIEELESRLNEEIETNVQLAKQLTEAIRDDIILDASDDLTDTQAEKLKSLTEGVEFSTADEFAKKVQTIKENYFPSKTSHSEPLDRAESSTDGKGMIAEQLDGPMAAYVKSLGKKLPK